MLLLWLPLLLVGQRYAFDFESISEGLSDRQITELYLGEEGFLWVGTRDGLNRFDGYNFLPFDQGPFSEAGLSLGNIDRVGRDLEGNMVIFYQNFNGYFDRFDPGDFSIEQVELNPATGVTGFPRALATDEFGRVFVLTVSKKESILYEYTTAGFVAITSLPDERETISPAAELLPLRNGQFLIFDSDFGMRLLSATGELIETVDLKILDSAPLFGGGNFERLEFLREGADGRVYFSFYGHRGVYRYRPGMENTPGYVPELPTNLYYSQAEQDQLGQLLFFARPSSDESEQSKRFFLHTLDGRFENYDELVRGGSRIQCAAGSDFREKIYLGMYDGLRIVTKRREALRNYLAVEQEEEYFQQLVRGIVEDHQGTVYFTEQNGQLYRIDPELDLTDSLYLHLPSEDGDLLEIKGVHQLIYDKEGHAIWGCGQSLGGDNNGVLYRYDIRDCTTQAFYYPNGAFNCFTRSEEGIFYLGASRNLGSGQLVTFDPSTEIFLPLVSPQGRSYLSQETPMCLTLSQGNKRLFVGTDGKGMLFVELKTGKVHQYRPTPWKEEEVMFNDYTVYVIHENPDSSLYVGTRGGLHHFDPKREELRHYGRGEGLSSNIVSAIVPDGHEGFWISTYNGLNHFQPNGKPLFQRYYRTDGLSNDEFNRLSGLRTENGRYYFGGINGLTTFYPQELQSSDPPPDVLLSKIVLYGTEERILLAGLNDRREITVEEDEKGIAIHLATPATELTERTRFRVRLEGLNTDWVDLGDEHIVRYSNLKSGNYRFHAQATDANGSYALEQELVLPIRVYRYFYEQAWFLVLIALTIVGFIIGFLQSRSRERLRNEQLRTQLSSDIHDEVSGLLAGITMQTELLQSYTEDDHLKTRLKGVGEAGRKAMSKMSDVIWSIDSRRDTVGDLLQRMQEHADDVLLPLEIKYTFRAEGFNEKDRRLTGSKRQDIYFIYKEVVNNIARHSNATKVNVYLGLTGNEFEMIIRDNGEATNGFDARKSAKTGQGLANLRMRAKRLDAELTVNKRGDQAMHLRMRKV
ncbi:hypothetical protein CEQ90_14660 [Lewinellaceae bacterium SD302]|nr:hypothetical protein CEQ90_14660 [Lewinellaceae bacterium SD302]